jgi:hypothetical protein
MIRTVPQARILLPLLAIVTTACATTAPAGSGAEDANRPIAPGSWSLLPAGDLPTQRHEGGYVRVGSLFYLIGGRGTRNVEAFDPATGRWTSKSPPPFEIHHFQGVEYDGRIYLLGAMTGRFPTEPPVPRIMIYDPATDRWSEGSEVPADRRRGGAGVVVHDGLIYVVSGITNGHTDGHVTWVDSFDPRTGTWRRLADAPRARDHFQAVVIDGKIYAAGGRRSSGATGQVFDLTVPEVDVYDIASNSWTTLPAASNLPTPRAGNSAVVLDGKLIIIGGESGARDTAHPEVDMLDPATGRWTRLAPLQVGRHATAAILHDDRIYIASGSRTRGATEINSQEVFTPGPAQ